MPLLLPPDEFGSDREFFPIHLGKLGELDVLEEEFVGIHVEFGGKIIQSAHGEDSGLRMVGRAPPPVRAYVAANGGVLLALVGSCETIWNRRHDPGAPAPRAPR